MVRILHVLDQSAGWEQRVALTQLVHRLPADRFAHLPAILSSRARAALPETLRNPIPLACAGGRGILAGLVAPALGRVIRRYEVDLIHAWGVSAAFAACVALQPFRSRRVPVLLESFDPALSTFDRKILRMLTPTGGLAIACASQTVRRRLIEAGITPEACTVIRSGADFALINQYRKGDGRQRLGVSRGECLALLSEPVRREHGHFDAFWAAALTHHLSGSLRIVVPGLSQERDRIVRFAETLPDPVGIIAPGNELPFDHLLAIADVVLVPSDGDVSTTGIAWAMAASAAVIAAAGYAVAEIIAHKVNGLLYKRDPDRGAVIPVMKLLSDRDAQQRVKETARGQAYEIFSARRYADQHARLYQNLLAQAPPSDGITDPAGIS